MVEHSSWISILPPLLAIALAIISRQVILSLGAGIWLGYWLLDFSNPVSGLARAIDGAIAVLGNPGDAKVILFALVIGALLAVVERMGGVRGFAAYLEGMRWVDRASKAQWLAWLTGVVIFIESNLTLLVAGSVSRPLFDRFRVSRERLAYLIDSTSAPICILIPLNAWGAFNLGLLDGVGVPAPIAVFVAAIPLNFYAWFAVVLAALTITFNWRFGPMRQAEARAAGMRVQAPLHSPSAPRAVAGTDRVPRSRALFMAVPILTMIAAMPIGLYITGDGDLAAGSGATAVLWAVLAGLTMVWAMALSTGGTDVDELLRVSLQGAGKLLPIALILLLALALGDVANLLGTGSFMARAIGDHVPVVLLPALAFLVAAAMSFSIGSSWGTFAIMIPIVMPIALESHLSPPLLLGALLSGAIFGDHASPISDTTVVASMAADVNHIEHVRTQLPYALAAGGLAAICYLGAGLLFF